MPLFGKQSGKFPQIPVLIVVDILFSLSELPRNWRLNSIGSPVVVAVRSEGLQLSLLLLEPWDSTWRFPIRAFRPTSVVGSGMLDCQNFAAAAVSKQHFSQIFNQASDFH